MKLKLSFLLIVIGALFGCNGNHRSPPIPTPPSNLKVKFDQKNLGMLISWQDNSNNEDGFIIERKRGITFPGLPDLKEKVVIGEKIGLKTFELPANTEGYFDTEIIDQTEYCYRVAAFNSAGTSAFTPKACLITQFPPLPPPPLATPTSLMGSCSPYHYLELSWHYPKSQPVLVEGFLIERSKNEKDWQEIDRVWAVGEFDWSTGDQRIIYYDQSIQEGQAYFYRVAAYNQTDISDYSNEAYVEACSFSKLIEVVSFSNGLITNVSIVPLIASIPPEVDKENMGTLTVNGQKQEFYFQESYLVTLLKLEKGINTIFISLNITTGGFTEKEIVVYYEPDFSTAELSTIYCLLDKSLVILAADSMDCLGQLNLAGENYQGLEFSLADGRLFVVAKNQISVIETAFHTLVEEVPLSEEFSGVTTISKDGKQLFLGSNRQITVYDTESWEVIKSFSVGSPNTEVAALALNLSESKIYVGIIPLPGRYFGIVEVYSWPDGQLLRRFHVNHGRFEDAYIKTIAFSPDGNWGVVTNASWTYGIVFVFDPNSDSKVYSFLTEKDFARYVWFEPDSQHFWLTDDKFIYRIETETGQRIERFPKVCDGHRKLHGREILLGQNPEFDFYVCPPCASCQDCSLNKIAKVKRAENETVQNAWLWQGVEKSACIQDLIFKP